MTSDRITKAVKVLTGNYTKCIIVSPSFSVFIMALKATSCMLCTANASASMQCLSHVISAEMESGRGWRGGGERESRGSYS